MCRQNMVDSAATVSADRTQARVVRPDLEPLLASLDHLEQVPSNDERAALAMATQAEQDALTLGRPDLQMRARMLRGDALDRVGDFATAGRLAREVCAWAAQHGDRALLAGSHRRLTWISYHLGDTAGQLEHAIRAVECLDEQTSDRMRCDSLTALAAALHMTGSYNECLSRYQMAEDLAILIGDPHLHIKVLNNRCCTYSLAGDVQAAMDDAQRMLDIGDEHDLDLGVQQLDSVARAQLGVGRYDEAERTLQDLEPPTGNHPGVEGDELPQALLTLAEAQRFAGSFEQALSNLDQCVGLCTERGLTLLRVRTLRERAELFAVQGQFREAYDLHKVFHDESEAFLSAERESRAHTLQAIFETDEARKDSVRFREMSLHDPLTGLYNRRYVDERLDSLLNDAARTGATLSVGLVDVDFFKRINDTYSHAVGDDVLVQLAELLMSTATDPAFAARLGGEEFLVVLPGCGAAEATSRCESARLLIRGHDWSGLTGDAAITVSIGVSTVVAGQTPRSVLLANADRNLYAAKRAGRDLVVADPA